MDISIVLPWTASLQQSSLQVISTICTVVVSIAALFFSIYFSWRANWRKGKIIVSDPLLFAINVSSYKPKSLLMKIPLNFLNDGGATRFIQDIELILEQKGKESKELYFIDSSPSMDSDDEQLAQQFTIEGHKAYSATFLFYRETEEFVPSVGVCRGKIKAKIDDEDWKLIHEFDFKISDLYKFDFNPDYCDGRWSIPPASPTTKPEEAKKGDGGGSGNENKEGDPRVKEGE